MPAYPCRCIVSILALLSLAPGLNGQSAANLIALVPAGTGLVVGMSALNPKGESRDFFVPLPGKSLRDFDYFRSLCGVDPTKIVNEVIFADTDLSRDDYAHSLMARGRFNPQILYKSAINQGAVEETYRGQLVLRVPPLPRERSEFSEFTSLVIIDSRVLLLGTPEYVRQEIDRVLTGSSADPLLTGQFDTIRGSDVWWIILRPYDTSKVRKALISLSSELADAMDHSSLCVGTRFGKYVDIVYQIEISPVTEPDVSRRVPQLAQFAIVADEKSPSRGVIRIPRKRYRQWVSDIASHRYTYR